eukprot:IDg9212t1
MIEQSMRLNHAAFTVLSPFAPRLTRRCIRKCGTSMSGVNGGIDYDIDLDALPIALASRVRAIQRGPESPSELISAAKYIASAVPSTPETLPVLVDMLGYNNPVAARIAVDALAIAGSEAIPALLTGVGAFNYAVNAYALRALARIADPSVVSVCVACAMKGPIPGVRRAACAALAALQFSEESVRPTHSMPCYALQTENLIGVSDMLQLWALSTFTQSVCFRSAYVTQAFAFWKPL